MTENRSTLATNKTKQGKGKNMENINCFQKQALIDLKYAGFDAYPSGNIVRVTGGYRSEPIYSVQGVHDFIASNYPPAYE